VFLDNIERESLAKIIKMDELFRNSNTQNMFAQLGTRIGNDYVPSKNCYSKYNV